MPARVLRRVRRLLPRSFQARLTLGFVLVTAITLAASSTVVIYRLDEYFRDQVKTDLSGRAVTVRDFVALIAVQSAAGNPVVSVDNRLNADVRSVLSRPGNLRFLADRIALADISITFGKLIEDSSGTTVVPAVDATFSAPRTAAPSKGQAREAITISEPYPNPISSAQPFGMIVTLSDPYTFRESALATATTLLIVIALVALLLSIAVASFLARRFTAPLRRLTEAARGLAEGDLSTRVPAAHARAGSSELAELSRQFNQMADRLEESVEIIRRDRDRSRDFLADVSHELRTPIAALRTFTELLQGHAGDDPEARREFLESGIQQLERLDWLAQNLLDLSKLDSGLVLLDLRPDDLRACVESAVEQAEAAARRRGLHLALVLPDAPLRIRHDPLRIGQVVANLVGNALKFTARGGSVRVELRPHRDGALIDVRDTGVGIDAAELPRIFDRFYRGSQANEARGSGSGLGLAIVKSIVDMHRGRISVESRVGVGTTFSVVLPRDPRTGEEVEPSASEQTRDDVAKTSPVEATRMNPWLPR